MLIPIDVKHKKFKKGDIVVLTKDIERRFYIFTKGHEMIYYGEDGYGIILKDIETGYIIKKARPSITHKVTFEEAKTINKAVVDKKKFTNFIYKHCPHSGFTYEDREEVRTCLVERGEKGYKGHYCKPTVGCFPHLPKELYKNDSFILNYSRRLKLKEIKIKIIDNKRCECSEKTPKFFSPDYCKCGKPLW